MAEEISHDAVEQELREQYAFEHVDRGESIVGLFPLAAENVPGSEEWKKARTPDNEETA
jgi:hypothetical protein